MADCAICGGSPATVTKRALNGLPVGVVACDACREAVKRREVGVVVREGGSLHVTDGRLTSRLSIISGGQTGADQGGLEAAQMLGLQTGGYAPKGWMTESGPKPQLARLGLVEWPTPGYPARTEANIQIADGTLIFGHRSPGSDLTHALCLRHHKCVYWVGDLTMFNEESKLRAQAYVKNLLGEWWPHVLNIAGNRESVTPGIQEAVTDFLVLVLS